MFQNVIDLQNCSVEANPKQIQKELMEGRYKFRFQEGMKNSEKIKKMATYTGLQVSHPYIKELANAMEEKQTLTQALIRMAEIPVKFGNDKQISQSNFYKELEKIKIRQAEEIKTFRPIYDDIQKLKETGTQEEVQQAVDDLSDTQYAVYKKIRSSEKTANTNKAKVKMYDTYKKIQDLKEQGELDKVQTMVDDMTDEEYKVYQSVKKQFGEGTK